MRIVICDRCKAKIPDGTRIGYIAANWRETYGGDLVQPNPYENWDLCEDCMKKIVAVADGLTQAVAQALDKAILYGDCINAADHDLEEDPDEEDPDEEDPEEEDEDAEDPNEEAEAISRIAGTPPNAKPVNLRELRELVKQGKTAKEIADHFGISVATYYKYRKKAERLYITGNL